MTTRVARVLPAFTKRQATDGAAYNQGRMEPPSIPRMPETRYRFLWGALAFNMLRMGLEAAFGRWVTWVTVAGLAAAYAYVIARWLYARWRIRRTVHFLRGLTAESRNAVFDQVPEGDKAYFEHQLAEHGAPQAAGVVERFEFSPVDRRELAFVTGVTTVVAVLTFLAGAPIGFANMRGTGMLSCALVSSIGVFLMLRKSEQLSSSFEVSPFGISEVLPNGSVRQLLWGYGLLLRNRPWLRRIEVGPENEPQPIAIPYSVVGFDRLLTAIIEKGGFARDTAAAE